MKRIGFFKAPRLGLWAALAFSGVLSGAIVPAHAQTTPPANPPAPNPVPVPPAPPSPPVPNPAPNPSPNPVPGTPTIPTTPKDPRAGDTPGAVVPQTSGTPAPTATPTPAPTPAPKTIEELTKGYDKVEGFFTIYKKTENNRQRMLAEIKESQIGQLFILQTTFASGNAERVTAGRPLRDIVWKWSRTPDDRLLVDVPNLWYRSSDPNLKVAVERDFPDAYLDVFPILAKSSERKSVLIDFASFFDGGIPGLNTLLSGGTSLRTAGSSYALDPELSFLQRLKNFPTNMVVEYNYHYKGGSSGTNDAQADPRSLPIKVVFNLYGLPEGNGYKPRLADARVGYFVNGQLSAGRIGFDTFDEARYDPRVVYINRWNLQKADPSAKLSPPVKPITFYLDTSVPARYRDVMREGLLSWNSAFLPLGITDAIVVRDAPTGKDADALEYDHADMRFNTLRWVASPPDNSAYAVALMRENPLTGEILNASITVNANFARIAYLEKQNVINPLASSGRGASDANSPGAFAMGAACELTGQVVDPRFTDERYVKDLLRATVTHEFGHILGLRHNFIASLYESPQALANPVKVRQNGISASVMDYVGFNVFGLRTHADLFARGPGIYDKWAISYGYTSFSPASENVELKKIAARSIKPGLAYSSDELADGYDPTSVRYDLSSDPLAYAEKSSDVTRELLRNLLVQFPKPGEDYSRFTSRLRTLAVRAKTRDAVIALRFVGGYRVRHIVRGAKTTTQPFSPVPVSQQRRALALLNREIFAASAFNVPETYLAKQAPDPFDASDDPDASAAFPLRDQIAAARAAVLNSLLNTSRLRRISNGEWAFKSQMLPLSELFASVHQGVWGTITPLTTYSNLQRDLAGTHVQTLITLATDTSAPVNDARLLAGAELRALQASLKAPVQKSPDRMTRLFCADIIRRIDNGFKKESQADTSSGGLRILF